MRNSILVPCLLGAVMLATACEGGTGTANTSGRGSPDIATTAKGEILCEPDNPHFKSRRTSVGGVSYYDCYTDKRDVSVAAYFIRRNGFTYRILIVGWTLENNAAPLQVIASSLSMKYVDPDGQTAQLHPVWRLDPNIYSVPEIVYYDQHGLTATTIDAGSGYSGSVYFDLPDWPDPIKDRLNGRYVAEVHVRDNVIAFEFPAKDTEVSK